jgi:hypothetical protein
MRRENNGKRAGFERKNLRKENKKQNFSELYLQSIFHIKRKEIPENGRKEKRENGYNNH